VLEFVRTARQYANLTTRDLADVDATLDGRTNNRADAQISGIDLTVAQDFRTSAGLLALSLSANYFLSFETTADKSTPRVSILNTLSNPVDLRARGQVTWTSGGWSISGALNYVNDYIDNQLPELRKISSWSTIDLSAAYEFRNSSGWLRGLTLRSTIVNAADKAPPPVIDRGGSYGNVGYDTENANALGRFISLQISKAW
jgi:iron complex outermembrane receptor protein